MMSDNVIRTVSVDPAEWNAMVRRVRAQPPIPLTVPPNLFTREEWAQLKAGLAPLAEIPER